MNVVRSLEFANALCGCLSLSNLTIPRSVEYLERQCFCNCRSLENFSFEHDSVLISIGTLAFFGCVSLKELVIPGTVSLFWANSLGNCRSLASITLERGSKLKTEQVRKSGVDRSVKVTFVE